MGYHGSDFLHLHSVNRKRDSELANFLTVVSDSFQKKAWANSCIAVLSSPLVLSRGEICIMGFSLSGELHHPSTCSRLSG